MSNCRDKEIQLACFKPSDGSPSVTINHTIIYDSDGVPIATYFSDREGVVIDETSYLGGGEATLGDCVESQLECVESQEWTYALDNTGTYFAVDNTIELTLSDGTTMTFFQPATNGWTPQMQDWADKIQAEADAAGLRWFAETRYRNPSNPADLSGGGGFSGPPSLPVSNALTSMLWRYVNIQICPGQPTPVSARIVESSNPIYNDMALTTDGPVKGPLQRFFVYRNCADEPVWYLDDNETLAEEGQIPDCFEPCGVISQLPAPPENDCTFEIDVACDNNNSQNTVDFINTITRRAKVCNGEQIAVDYFQADPNDPNALIPYTLVGAFVDCATGEPIKEPEPEYFEIKEHVLCEIDARFLLLIDSGGAFARYSFYTGKWENVSTLSVASAGGSADVENFLLYNFVAPDQITVIDVNTDTQLPNITVVDGVINPAIATNPKTFSAAAFRKSDGKLYAWDTAGTDAGLYCVDLSNGEVDFVTNVSGVSGAGTSIMIDNVTDTLYINGSNLSYAVDWATGVGTLWGNPPIQPNGGTFDESGNAYVTQGNNTYQLPVGADANDPDAWVQLIDDWTPGANSIAYYETLAASPSCFVRRIGLFEDGTSEVIGDFNILDYSPRTIVGEVDCCNSGCCDGDEQSNGVGSGATAQDIGAEVEAQDTYKGPTPEEIADAIVRKQRDVTPQVLNVLNSNTVIDLGLPAGTFGRIVSIEDTGTGLVRWTIDGSTPANGNGFITTGPYHSSYNLQNVDLSLVRIQGSSNNSDYSVAYEIYN